MQADISAAIAARYDDLNIEWNVDVTAYPSIVALFEEHLSTQMLYLFGMNNVCQHPAG